MSAPLIWRRLAYGIKIQDLTDEYFDKILALTEKYYMTEDFLCKQAKILEDKDSVDSFLSHLYNNLWDYKSVIALDERNQNAIAGFLILRKIPIENYVSCVSRTKLVQGRVHIHLTELLDMVQKGIDVYELLQCKEVLRYYLLCILPAYRKAGLGCVLFEVAWDVARAYNIPAVMGFFNNHSTQYVASGFNMQVLKEIYYLQSKDSQDELIIPYMGTLNSSFALMAGKVPPEPIPDPLPKPPQEKAGKGKKGKKGKKDKKNKKGKNKK